MSLLTFSRYSWQRQNQQRVALLDAELFTSLTQVHLVHKSQWTQGPLSRQPLSKHVHPPTGFPCPEQAPPPTSHVQLPHSGRRQEPTPLADTSTGSPRAVSQHNACVERAALIQCLLSSVAYTHKLHIICSGLSHCAP